MQKDFLTLQEAAVLLGKSVQTVRRLIKKGELKAQKIKTPQGFHYVVEREKLGIQMFSDSPIQNDDMGLEEAWNGGLTNQNEILTNQTEVKVQEKADFEPIDKKVEFEVPIETQLDVPTPKPEPTQPIVEKHVEHVVEKVLKCESCAERADRLRTVLDKHHEEKMGLIRVLEKLQKDLDWERRRPRSFMAYLMDWLLK